MDDQEQNTPWTGRDDGPGADHARWHKVVALAGNAPSTGSAAEDAAEDRGEAEAHISLLGFSSDEGVRRNHGRVGAAQGPDALRRALAPMALHGPLATEKIGIIDYGNVRTEGQDLESGQATAAHAITRAMDAPGAELTVVLGGGHETAWASYLGLMDSGLMKPALMDRASMTAAPADPPRWGVLNLDAHFDLRSEDRASSGTPFLQMAEAEQTAGRSKFNYAVLGIAEPSNTAALFDRAESLGVRWMTDLEWAERGPAAIREFIADFAADLDVLYLTIDLDVLPAAAAPGVSAPAALGVPTPLVASAVRAAAATGKLRLLDVVELNPTLDEDQRTAKTAARLIDEAVREAFGARP